VLLDVRMRRALQHAIDRQVIVDNLLFGKTPLADSSVAPNEADFKDIESAIVHYPYDPQRAAQLMTDLGYSRGGDGVLQDSSGQRLTIEARSNNQLDTQVKALRSEEHTSELQALGQVVCRHVLQKKNEPKYRPT